MGLKEYTFKTPDGRTETMLLDEKDAKAVKAANDAALAAAKNAADTDGAKAKRPANKADTPANKSATDTPAGK